MSRRPRHQHTENNQRGLQGKGGRGACSVTDRKTVKRTTRKFNRKETRLHIEEQTEPTPKPRSPTWYFVKQAEYKMKCHCVPSMLRKGIVQSLLDRGIEPPIESTKRIKKWCFDIPGPCFTDRSWHDLHIPGLTVEVPSTDVEFMRDRLAGLQPRSEFGTPYYKLHDGTRCLCLTPEMRDQLLTELNRVLPEARAIATVENTRMNKAWEAGAKKGVLFQAHPRPVGKVGGNA
jgi:hypothetical protein